MPVDGTQSHSAKQEYNMKTIELKKDDQCPWEIDEPPIITRVFSWDIDEPPIITKAISWEIDFFDNGLLLLKNMPLGNHSIHSALH
jgi:hypothetical protein